MADNADRIAELEETVRLLTIQNNARATIIAGHQSMGWDRRAEHLARAQLDSQREANARLTNEVEQLQASLAAAEAARDAAISERDEANATLRYCEQQWSDTDRVTLDKMLDERRRADAALARAERLEKALRIVDQDARDHIRSDEIAPALLRPHALRAVRAALADNAAG
jgi:hypothetical protein